VPEVTPQTEDRRIRLADGRALGFAEFGEPLGFPCLYFHGWPGSRLEAGLFDEAGREQNLRIIAVDRPGVGRSEFQTKRRLVDWPQDIETLASKSCQRERSLPSRTARCRLGRRDAGAAMGLFHRRNSVSRYAVARRG
jgi:pimeloyl-ACP methyl ester carboxylesterase